MRFLVMTMALLCSVPAAARVTEVGSEGFTIALTADVQVPRERVFSAFSQPNIWWDSEHSWSGELGNISFEPRVGGCWCEALANGGGVEHGRIVTYDPGHGVIVMNSLLGPLMDFGIAGRLIWRVEAADEVGHSQIRWLYQVSVPTSHNPAQDAVLAAVVDRVLSQQLTRLAAHVSGAPMPAPAP